MIPSPPNILIIHSKESELQRVEEFIKEVFAMDIFAGPYYRSVIGSTALNCRVCGPGDESLFGDNYRGITGTGMKIRTGFSLGVAF